VYSPFGRVFSRGMISVTVVFNSIAGMERRVAGKGRGVAVGTRVGVNVGKGVAGGNWNAGVFAIRRYSDCPRTC
jgi:hypothetical protein